MKVKTILIITFFAFIYGQPEDCSDGRYINETIQLISDFNCEPGIVLHAVNNYRDRLEKITEKIEMQ